MSDLVDVVIPPLPGQLTYRLHQEAESNPGVGAKVWVPLGRRHVEGYIVSRSSQEDRAPQTFALKSVENREAIACFDPAQLPFFEWVAAYYGEPISQVMDTAIPPVLSKLRERWITVCDKPSEQPRGKTQLAILKYLSETSKPAAYSEFLRHFPRASQSIKKLVEGGFIDIASREIEAIQSTILPAPDWAISDVELNSDQQSAITTVVNAMKDRSFQPLLLHGVTGSGKTEVYIEAIREALRDGRGALVIVPEIALTPQLVDRFVARVGREISVLHSGLNQRARWDAWRALLEGKHLLAIGARSAVFAPVKNLSLIVVDEEHDNSFKQAEGLRYHARDLAVTRAKLLSCPVVLGSATPSLESFGNAIRKKYAYASLPIRFHAGSGVDIQIVDIGAKRPWEMKARHVSPELYDGIKETLDKKEQAFVLYNRRGFSSYMQCDRCTQVLQCPNCSVTFTYHQHDNSLHCHYCSLTIVPPTACQNCVTAPPDQSGDKPKPGTLVHRGAGTEKIYEELLKLFPDAKIDRLDRDSAQDLDTYRAILKRLRDRETDILVGTQMIAKGHDLPHVTVVGVADCDVGLHLPDFRAGERIFQLLTQAAGRAGRAGKMGRVILQTRVPTHASLVATTRQDYTGFAKAELSNRKALLYPPFSRLIRVVASAQDNSKLESTLALLRERIEEFKKARQMDLTLLGPAPAPLERLRTQWRWHLMIKCDLKTSPRALVRFLRMEKAKIKGVKVVIDIDPVDLL